MSRHCRRLGTNGHRYISYVVGGVNMKKYVKTPPSYIHIYVYIFKHVGIPLNRVGGWHKLLFRVSIYLVLRCIHIYTDVYIYTMYIKYVYIYINTANNVYICIFMCIKYITIYTSYIHLVFISVSFVLKKKKQLFLIFHIHPKKTTLSQPKVRYPQSARSPDPSVVSRRYPGGKIGRVGVVTYPQLGGVHPKNHHL